MKQDELYSKVEGGELSPADLQRLRDPIFEHTGLRVPRRRSEMRDWYDVKKSVLTRKLKPDEDNDTNEDSDNDQQVNE